MDSTVLSHRTEASLFTGYHNHATGYILGRSCRKLLSALGRRLLARVG